MNKLMPWIKSNLISVIALAVAIIAAPVMLFFSFGWSGKIHKDVEAKVGSSVSQIEGLDVSYRIDPYLSGQQAVEAKAAPNTATTNAVAALLEAVRSESQAVRQRAIDFNSAGKKPLISGPGPEDELFPGDKLSESGRLRLLDRMVALWPRTGAELLREHRAGAPAPLEQVRAQLEQQRKKLAAQMTNGRDENALSPEDRERLNQQMGDYRLDVYRAAARNVCFYAEPDIFRNIQRWDITKVLPIETAWDWQHIHWVHQDVIRAIARANTDSSGNWLPVFRAPVKRVESIIVSKPGEASASEGERAGGPPAGGASTEGGAPAAGGDDSGEIARNFTLAHTGRAGAPVAPNPLYDVRYADLTVIASSAQLTKLLDAFPQTNFMTVIGLDVSDVDPLPALALGYDFGAEHLVRARIRIETLWIRSWMKKYMPHAVRAALGIPDEASPPAEGQPATEGGEQPASQGS